MSRIFARKEGRAPPLVMLLSGGALTILLLGVVLYPPSMIRSLEYAGYDEMLRFVGGTLPPSEVAVIDVDEFSLAELGQWPWPRYRIAALIDKAAALGARSIAVDFLFPEHDGYSLERVSGLYQSERGVSVDLSDVPDNALDNDRILAESVARHNVVLGADLVFSAPQHSMPANCGNPLKVILRALPGAEGPPPVPQAFGTICPIPELVSAARLIAAVNPLQDRDGKLRRSPLILRSGEQYVPSLALAALLAAWREDQLILQWSAAGVLEIGAGPVSIATDFQGNILIPYRMRPPDRFQRISAVDLLEGRVEQQRLQDKIVFIGSTASGLRDRHATPNMRSCSGLDIHAFTADAILRGDFFVEPGWVRGVQVLTVLLLGLLVSALMAWAPITIGAGITGGASVALTLGSWMLLKQWGVYFSAIPGLWMLIGASSLLALVRLRWEEKSALEQIRELALAQDCALLGLVSITETRDPETGQHIARTQRFVKILADHLSHHPKFRDYLTPENIQTIYKSAPLHDIGKVAVPDSILLKPGRLTKEEFEIIKLHAIHGYAVLVHAEKLAGLPQELSFLRFAKELTRSHHEKWDGTGYPDGLKGEEIPISARLMALADVYDALCAKRVYKDAMPHEKAREIICEGRGKQFDPLVVDAFLALEHSFQEITKQFADIAADSLPSD